MLLNISEVLSLFSRVRVIDAKVFPSQTTKLGSSLLSKRGQQRFTQTLQITTLLGPVKTVYQSDQETTNIKTDSEK